MTHDTGASITPLIVFLIIIAMAAHYVRTNYFNDSANVKGDVADRLLGGIGMGPSGTSHEL